MQTLVELERIAGKKCDELFNYFGGASIGGLVALMLASGKSAREALKIVMDHRNQLFGSPSEISDNLEQICKGKMANQAKDIDNSKKL